MNQPRATKKKHGNPLAQVRPFLGHGHKETSFLSDWDAGKEGFKGDSQQNASLLGICTVETSTTLTGL